MNDCVLVFPFNIPGAYSNYTYQLSAEATEKSTYRTPWVSSYSYWQSWLPSVYDRKGPTYSLAVLERRRAWLMATSSVETLSWTAWHTALLAFPWADFQTYPWKSLWKSNKKNHQLWSSAMGSPNILFPHFHIVPFSTTCQKGKDKDTIVIWLWQTYFQPSSILSDSLLGHDRPQSTGFKLQK